MAGVATTASKDFRATDQDAWIDTDGPAHKAEHKDGANAEAAAARDAKTAPTAAAKSTAIVIAPVVDVVAATKIIVAHGGSPSFHSSGAKRARINAHQRQDFHEQINTAPGKNCLARKSSQKAGDNHTFTSLRHSAVSRF
jgi:hypothetical protein